MGVRGTKSPLSSAVSHPPCTGCCPHPPQPPVPAGNGAHLGVLALEHALPLLLLICTPQQLWRRDSHWEPSPIPSWSTHPHLGLAHKNHILPTSNILLRDSCSQMHDGSHRPQMLLGRGSPALQTVRCPLPPQGCPAHPWAHPTNGGAGLEVAGVEGEEQFSCPQVEGPTVRAQQEGRVVGHTRCLKAPYYSLS